MRGRRRIVVACDVRWCKQILLVMDLADSSASDQLKMLQAVHGVLPSTLCADGIAAALLTLLRDRAGGLAEMTTPQLVKKLRILIRSIAKILGGSFDGCELVEAMIRFPNLTSESSTIDLEDK